MGVQTDKVMQDIKGKKTDAQDVSFIDMACARRELGKDIAAAYQSYSKFAMACDIHNSHLSEYLNCKKDFGRDNLLTMFFMLKYDLERVQTMLVRLAQPPLYVRNKRDYHIACAISDKKSLEEIDQILDAENLEPVSSYAKEIWKQKKAKGAP